MKIILPTAHIIIGFIGAGKTTFARKLEKETGAVRITKDEWMVRIFGNRITADKNFELYDKNVTGLAKDMALTILKSGGDVIIDEGFWVKSQREEIKKEVMDVGAEPILYYIKCPMEIMRSRVVSRSKILPVDSFEISGEMFDSYLKYWQAPEESENVIVINSSE